MPTLVLLLAAVLWGLTWYPLQYFHAQAVDGVPLILVAYGTPGLLLLPLLLRQRGLWRGEGHLLAWLFVLGGYANLAFASSMIYGEVVRAMMLFYLAPVWGVLGARVFLGEAIDRRRWLGVALAILGAFLVLGGPALWSRPPQPIDLLATSAGLAFALSNVTARAAGHLPEASKVAAVFLGCGALAALLLGIGFERLPAAPPLLWGGLAVFGVTWLLAATAGSVWAVGRMEAGRASVIMVTELLAAVVSAAWLGGETLEAIELAGGGLILAAALLEGGRRGAGQA